MITGKESTCFETAAEIPPSGYSQEHLGNAHEAQGTIGMHVVKLDGCAPVPLASYLKGLGILRLVVEQKDPDARAWWQDERLHLQSRLTLADLHGFFLNEYRPTPILSPWSGRAGFLEGEAEGERSTRMGAVILQAAEASTSERLDGYRILIRNTKQNSRIAEMDRIRTDQNKLKREKKWLGAAHVDKRRIDEQIKQLDARLKVLKGSLLMSLRSELPEDTVEWIDACFAIADDIKTSGLLGTGGNEGAMDFSINHLDTLLRLISPNSSSEFRSVESLLWGALVAEPVREWGGVNPGLLSPASLGGPNMGSGFYGALHDNPWDAVLMLEGALLFSTTVTRRQGASPGGNLSFPFALEAVNAGHGGVSATETARPEIWAPLWDKPATLDEVRALFSEGRITLGRKPARTALDAARAIARLGANRGIKSFQRFGFYERRGQGYYVTVPLERRLTSHRPTTGLIDDLARQGWLTRFRRMAGAAGTPARLNSLIRRLEDGIFDLTGAKGEDVRTVQGLLITLGEAMLYFAESPKARAVCPPLSELSATWVTAADDGSAEYRLALALAGIHARQIAEDGRERPVLPLIAHLAPLSLDGRGTWDENPDAGNRAVWGPGRLEDNLAAIVERRLLDAASMELTDKPFRSWSAASLGTVAALLHQDVDQRRIARLLLGLALIRRPSHLRGKSQATWPIPAAYAVLKPFFTSDVQLRRAEVIASDAALPLPSELVSYLMIGRINDAVRIALHRLRTIGLTPRMRHLIAPEMDGKLLLSALLVPIPTEAIGKIIRLIVQEEVEIDDPSTFIQE